jgi:hypothetical protein
MFMPKIWRNEISKIVTRLRQNPGQASADSNDFKYTNRVLSNKINPVYTREIDNNIGCENYVNQEIKCATCGSTNLIKISDYRKAKLFLGNINDNPKPEKIRSGHGMAKCNKFSTMWWCLNCKRLC